jgi:outer membrane protein assembly factor BamD
VSFLLAVLVAGVFLSCSGAREAPSPTAQDHYNKAKNRFDSRRFLDSTEQFKLLLDQYPGSKYVEAASFYLGMSYYETKEFPLAEVQFEKVVRDFPRGQHAEEATFMLAMCEFKQRRPAPYDQTQTEKAIQLFDAYVLSYPQGSFLARAEEARRECRATLAQKLYLTGRLYLKLKDHEAARLCFQEVLDKYGESRWADLALVGIGESYEKQANWKMASESYREVLARNGDREARDTAMQRLKKVRDKTGS